MNTKLAVPLLLVLAGLALTHEVEIANSADPFARDPGPRQTPPDAGRPLDGLSRTESAFFTTGKDDFEEAESVAEGLGPTMNLDSCVGCHSQPSSGGSSPAVNPQVAFAGKLGARNRLPSFIRRDGPVREVRFVKNPDGTADGGVHSLFTIAGRSDAGNCGLAQPDFDREFSRGNAIFRIPTPTFGAGLIEQIPDAAIHASAASTAAQKAALGIAGRPNIVLPFHAISGQTNNNGNDGTIARFGWKAQNKSLLLFAGEAYNVEMGISNELFQTERDETRNCQFATSPNSITDTTATSGAAAISAIEKFSFFMRFLAAPTPSADQPGGAASIGRGRGTFASVGCGLCHTPSLRTGNSNVAALRDQPVNLFSDLLIHDMGVALADGISQGQAGPREFRTAPLWGLGQRLFFLHDGRTSDLVIAIRSHASDGSEANRVVGNYLRLQEREKQDLLNFLRSL
ncbi:hypothetical protein AYO46_02240 [Betaproteobacteria bacterium SCGC AG-212-J23]|nr:hypothetical protein AYO46_02240 [Betaproteobacteria bacterium SCGC AG-212-J23]